MAVTTTTRKAGPFEGNGTATVFPFAFKVFAAADLYVIQSDSGGTLKILGLGTNYTVTLNANQDTTPGGSVALMDALAVGCRMTVTSDVQMLQQVVLTNLGGFFPDVLNSVFDRLTILIQQLDVQYDRALKLSDTDDLTNATLPAAPLRAGKYLYFGADGAPSLIAPSPMGTALFSGVLAGVKDGNNRVFALTNNGSAIGVTPLQATVWLNFPLIPGDPDGYALGPGPGQVTFAHAPNAQDSLFASGVMHT